MKNSSSQNNARGSVGPAAPFPTSKIPEFLSARYLHAGLTASAVTREDRCDEIALDTDARDDIDDITDESKSINNHCSVPGEAEAVDSATLVPYDPSVVVVNQETALKDSRSASFSVTVGVSAALSTLAKHCPPQLGWKSKPKRCHSALEMEPYYPRAASKRRQLIGLFPQQEEVLLVWLTHALAPSDVHGLDTGAVQDPCDSEVGCSPQETVSHISLKRRKTAHRVSLTSIPEVDEGRSYWLTRPLRTPWRFATWPKMNLSSPTSSPTRSPTIPVPVSPASSAHSSRFAGPHRVPSVIRWKLC